MIGQVYGNVEIIDEMLVERTFSKEYRTVFLVAADLVGSDLTITVNAEMLRSEILNVRGLGLPMSPFIYRQTSKVRPSDN